MEVILKKNVDKLGYKDEVVTVKDGYGRNFLIPKGYAVIATVSAKKAHAEVMKQRGHKEAKVKEEAETLAAQLEGLEIKVEAKVGETGKIFGSVNTIALAEAIKSLGVDMDRKSLAIVGEDSIKELGTYKAKANLHREVQKEFEFQVVEG